MTFKQSFSNSLVPKLHQSSALRAIAKKLLNGYTLQQSFHGGTICLDAVEHSWAWTGSRRYETFDCELQNKLLSLSQDREILIDIGSNIGAMSLSVLLHNPNITAVCIDPNSRAVALLQESVCRNQLGDRIRIIEAAVSDRDGILNFDPTGSVTGHISSSGKQVISIDFARFINEYSSNKCLVKMDVEGFEGTLLQQLKEIECLHNLCLVIELHPLHFNQVGNPNNCLNMLLNSGAIVEYLSGQRLERVVDENFTQIIARWSHA